MVLPSFPFLHIGKSALQRQPAGDAAFRSHEKGRRGPAWSILQPGSIVRRRTNAAEETKLGGAAAFVGALAAPEE
jgi:hypothetical protein